MPETRGMVVFLDLARKLIRKEKWDPENKHTIPRKRQFSSL